MNDNIIIIMAGGLGKRMESSLPKVLHQILDKPMLVHVIERSLELKPHKILVVVGQYLPIIKETLDTYGLLDKIEFVIQLEAKGTGHAIQCCKNNLISNDFNIDYSNFNVLILSGDVPLISKWTLQQMISDVNTVKLMVTKMEDPNGYGRIIEKDGFFEKIVEHKDCNENELLCNKVNAGIYVFKNKYLQNYLHLLNNNNAQQEYYLTDLVEIIKLHENVNIDLYEIPSNRQIELTGINTKKQLEELDLLLKSETDLYDR